MANENGGAPNLSPNYFVLTLDGTIQQVTTDKTIWSSRFLFQLNALAGGSAYIGTRKGTATAPVVLDDTDSLAELMPGGTYSPDTLLWPDRGGQQFQLEQFYISGPVGAKLRVSWPEPSIGVY